MTTQPENTDKAEQVSKDELSEKELEKATGGTDGKVTPSDLQIHKYVDKASTVLF